MEIDEKKLKQIIEIMNNSFFDSRALEAYRMLKELINEKWEPKKHDPNWYITDEGRVGKTSVSQKEYRLYGNEFSAQELAETARDMNKRNQLILQAKHEMGYRGGGWEICFDATVEEWTVEGGPEIKFVPELTFETKEQAETVLKMVGLND